MTPLINPESNMFVHLQSRLARDCSTTDVYKENNKQPLFFSPAG